jgi:RNA polymerase sigma factor (sigma-70 family)
MYCSRLEKRVQQFSDTEIINLIISGNTAMFEILIRRYNPYLYKIGRTYGFNHQDTEDLMQETFINSYINITQFAERSSFKTWLIKIMLNQCYRKAHKLSYRKEQATELIPDNPTYMFLENNSKTDNTVTSRELKKIIESSIQQLPPHIRSTFVLRELTGLSVAETADILHISTTNVKVRVNRAKVMLRKEIEKIYTPDDIYEFNLTYCDRIVDGAMKKIATINQINKLTFKTF